MNWLTCRPSTCGPSTTPSSSSTTTTGTSTPYSPATAVTVPASAETAMIAKNVPGATCTAASTFSSAPPSPHRSGPPHDHRRSSRRDHSAWVSARAREVSIFCLPVRLQGRPSAQVTYEGEDDEVHAVDPPRQYSTAGLAGVGGPVRGRAGLGLRRLSRDQRRPASNLRGADAAPGDGDDRARAGRA